MNDWSAACHMSGKATSNYEQGSAALYRQLQPRTTNRRAVLKNIRDLDLAPPHPGEIMREDMLPRLHLAPAGLAGMLGLPGSAITDLLAERQPVTVEIAKKLAEVFGHSIRFWLGLQAQYDRWLSRGLAQTA
jgi:antitoxin HigA-1